MFKNTKAFSSFSVNDIPAAKQFYKELLQLEVTEENGMLELHLSGGGTVLIYPKDNHEPASFTVLNFSVADTPKAVAGLKALGVAFESYHLPWLNTDENDILRDEEMGIVTAWFKDPAGNVLSVIQDL